MKIYLLFLLCLLCVFNIGFSYADMIKIRPEGANVRSEANSSSQKIGSASGGHKYTVLNSSNGWYQIELENSNIGWVSGRMGTIIADKNKAEGNIQRTNQNVQDVSQNGKKAKDISSAESRRGYIISGTNVRSGPGTEYDKIGVLSEKTEVKVYKSVNTDNGNWLEIGFEKNGVVQSGYVVAKKIKILTSLKIYEGICSYEEIISGTYQKKTNEIHELPSDGNVTVVYSDYGIYSGELKKSQRSGKGLFVWLNGDVYEGEWSKDKLNGNGKLRFSDGIVQEGIFRNNKLYEGTINKKQHEGSTVYRVVSKGSLKSIGTIVWPDGTVIEGSFDKEGVLKGKVTITYKNEGVKETYIGDVKNGKKSGKGTYTWGTGAHYKGNWKDDMMFGPGTYYYSSNEKKNYLKGNFENNLPVKQMTYVNGNGLRFKTIWDAGKCIYVEYDGRK